MTQTPHAPLAIEELRRVCATAHFGGTILYFDRIDSTNTAAARLAHEGAAEGTVVIAETQTHGRGRLGRTWVSPPFANLYLSIILRPPLRTAEAPVLALVVGLATAEALGTWTPLVGLKWPNDVLINGRKAAGILTEMDSAQDRVRSVIAGIGVNVNGRTAALPLELRDKATSLRDAVGHPVDRVDVAHRLLSRLEARYDEFVRQGFAALRGPWDALSCLHERRVEIEDGARRYAGTVAGLADDGRLRLRTDAGEEVFVVAGDVTVVGGYQRP